MQTPITAFNHIDHVTVSPIHEFQSLWSFGQRQLQQTFKMAVHGGCPAEICDLLLTAVRQNFLTFKFLTIKLTSYTVSDSRCMLRLGVHYAFQVFQATCLTVLLRDLTKLF